MALGTRVALASALMLLAATPARADFYVTPFIGILFAGDTTILDLDDAAGEKKLTYGGGVTVMGDGPLGVEGEFTFIPGFFERDGQQQLVTGSRVATLMGNVVLALPAGWTGLSPRPFVSGGVGMMRASLADFVDEFSYADTMLAMNIGGGIMGFFDERKGVRIELRYFRSIAGGDQSTPSFGQARLKYWRVGAGLILRY